MLRTTHGEYVAISAGDIKLDWHLIRLETPNIAFFFFSVLHKHLMRSSIHTTVGRGPVTHTDVPHRPKLVKSRTPTPFLEIHFEFLHTCCVRACPNRIGNRKRKSKSSGGWVKVKVKLPHFHVSDVFRFHPCFGRGVQTESKREKINAAEKHGRAATYGPFKTMNTCRQSSVRQHRATGAAGIHDDISTPGGRWASHGGGGRVRR